MGRFLNEEETKYVLSIKEDDITKQNLIKWFAIQKNTKPMFMQNDTFKLPANKLYNPTDTVTTVGSYIFNVFIVAPFKGAVPYINDTVNKGVLGGLESTLARLILDQKVSTEAFMDYLNRVQWLGYVVTDFMTPGMSEGIIIPNEAIQKRKAELLEKNKEALSKGDAVVAAQIEKELVDMSEKILATEDGYDIYKSKAKSSFGTHYKAFNIMKGPVKDNATGKYNICTSSYIDGVSLDEYHAFADTIVFAAHSRAVGTQDGGYITKKMFSAFQSLVLDKKGSDCGCTKTLDILLTKDNAKLFLFRYMVEGGKLVRLDNDNINNYIGKVVHFRSSMYCQSEKICNKCAGDLYYMLGIENAGLTVTKIGSVVLNLSLKNFHDTTVKTNRIDFTKYID